MGMLSSLFGFGGSKPATQQTIQASKLPKEIAPFAKDVLEDAQKLYEAQMEEGYKPYLDPTIAPMTPEQLQAQEGLKGLVGTSRPLQEEALGMYRAGADRFTDLSPEQMEGYMSPYQRAVTDIEKREAQKVFESQIMPQFEKQAVSAGGMSGMGSRAGVQAAQLGQAQMQQMGDIEAKGLQAAYQDARNLFQQQQQAQRLAAGDIAGMGPAMLASGISEQGLLSTIGEQKQALGQQALDEAYYRYLEEQAYPQEKLAGYSGFVYGNPLMQQRDVTTTRPAPQGPSTGSQLLGLGMTAAKMYGMGGGFGNAPGGFSWGNLFKKEGGGLSSLPVVYRQIGGGDLDEGEATNLLALSEEERNEAEKLAMRKASPTDRVEAEIKKATDRLRAGRLSSEEYQTKLEEDASNLKGLYTRRAGERKTASQAYQDRVDEARKQTFEEQRRLVPTGHPGYVRAMRSLLRGTPAGAPQRSFIESLLGGTTEYLGGMQEGEAAQQKALRDIEKRRGTAELSDLRDYETQRAADEAAAFKGELDLIKNVNPSLWKEAQKKEAQLRKAGLDEALIRTQMRHYLGQAQYNKARALKEAGIGADIKPGVYNAIRGTFKDMVEGGMFTGVPTADGGFRITGIRGKGQIKPADTAEINKILADALEIKDVAKAGKFIQDKLAKFGVERQDPIPLPENKAHHIVGHKYKVRMGGKDKVVIFRGDDSFEDVDEKE